MNKYLGILSSDTLNRDGYLMLFEALEQGVADNATEGMPSLIDHDFHRPYGWVFPFGILIEPKISKTIGNFITIETEKDMEIIYPKIKEFRHQKDYEHCKDYMDEFKELLGSNFSIEGSFLYKGCVAYNFPNIVDKLFPKLFNNIDKSGLVYLDDILLEFEYVGSGIFKSKATDFCLFCHQYFNRNLSLVNNYNTYFLDEFVSLNTNKDIKLRIAIDHNLIGLTKTYDGVLEFDYWFGPKFNDDISSLPNEVTRYESSKEQKFYNSILGTEFWWKTDGSEKTLEIEEIREDPSRGLSEELYGCRYIHSIYDIGTKEFIHFDGAVRVYSEEQILDRWSKHINKSGKNTDYTKLFRIDGKLNLADWKKLCILYYKGNPLLFEYFGAMDQYNSLRNELSQQDDISNFVPINISEKDGVRLFVSYHNKEEDYSSFERKVINPDSITFENGEILNVVEYDVLELEKFVKRKGGDLEYSGQVHFVKPYDYNTNYPIIIHGSNDTQKLIEDTLEAYKSIFERQNKSLNKTISFTLGWEAKDFEIRLSILGKSSEVTKWLSLNQSIPTDYESFKKWITIQKEWIYDNYDNFETDVTRVLKDDGRFYIRRKYIDREKIIFPNDDDESYFEIQTTVNTQLDKYLKEGRIFPSYITLLKKITCSKTGEDYRVSNTSKYLDEDVKMIIEEMEMLVFFWADEQYN